MSHRRPFKPPVKPADKPREQVRIDPTTGSMSIPGLGTKPMVGLDPGTLDAKGQEHRKRKLLLERQMRSTYQCTQCKRKFSGRYVRVKIRNEGGTKMEVLVCPDPRCDGPVIVVEDSLNLTRPPGGDKGAV